MSGTGKERFDCLGKTTDQNTRKTGDRENETMLFTEAGFCLRKGREEKSRVGESGSIYGTGGGGVGFYQGFSSGCVPLAHQGDDHRLLRTTCSVREVVIL